MLGACGQSKRDGRSPVAGIAADAEVVATVSVVSIVPFAVRVIVEGLKLQVDSEGMSEQSDEESVTDPLLLKPFAAVNVSVVEPDCPGAAMVMVVGFAVNVNVCAAGCCVVALAWFDAADVPPVSTASTR